MGGVVDKIKDIGDSIGDAFDDAVDFVEDAGRFIEETVEDTYKYVVEPMLDKSIEILHDATEYAIDSMDFVADDIFGISGAFDFLYNVNDGLEYIAYGIVEGDEKAIAVGAMVALSVVLTVVSFGTAAPMMAQSLTALMYLAGGGGLGLAMGAVAVGMVALGIYSIYSITLPLADIGKALNAGGMAGVTKLAEKVRSDMNLDYVNMNINGALSLWMAGGVLYDAPRAGGVLFNVTGSLNTTQFLGLQNNNPTPDMVRRFVNPEVHSILGVKAGDLFFKI